MTDEQILKKAIEKAMKKGWRKDDLIGKIETIQWEVYAPCGWHVYGKKDSFTLDMKFYFEHDFAKAFWGEEECSKEFPKLQGDIQVVLYEGKEWEYHLQIMVLESDPIKYLEKFL